MNLIRNSVEAMLAVQRRELLLATGQDEAGFCERDRARQRSGVCRKKYLRAFFNPFKRPRTTEWE